MPGGLGCTPRAKDALPIPLVWKETYEWRLAASPIRSYLFRGNIPVVRNRFLESSLPSPLLVRLRVGTVPFRAVASLELDEKHERHNILLLFPLPPFPRLPSQVVSSSNLVRTARLQRSTTPASQRATPRFAWRGRPCRQPGPAATASALALTLAAGVNRGGFSVRSQPRNSRGVASVAHVFFRYNPSSPLPFSSFSTSPRVVCVCVFATLSVARTVCSFLALRAP